MADRPIIFSAPMIAALLSGRKTQTRRILKPQPDPRIRQVMIIGNKWFGEGQGDRGLVFQWGGAEQVMRFAVGDRLYVRENHALVPSSAYRMSEGVQQTINPADRDLTAIYAAGWERSKPRWRPSIHMPRWASRLTLLVTDVRVERLQDISEADAAAEGVELESADPPFHYVPGIWPHSLTAVGVEEPGSRHAARSFAKLWGHINGPESWQANPWVVVVGFSVHARNIDHLAPIAEAAE